MTRKQLEHLIRASAAVTDESDIVIVGSQSILGEHPQAPESMLVSMEADLFPRAHPERSDLIDGTIGEGSYFHQTFGYYAQGVDETTSTLPAGWKDRLIKIAGPGTGSGCGWALETHDLLISKYVAGREKDREFTRDAARFKLANRDTLLTRLDETAVDVQLRPILRAKIQADFKA